ncbi:hypothetical protein [Haloferula sp. BvORR071]|uniref:hypothetical protein n=1 Tax=Haloferula sp. BvORR071 TaxID=1396141 RepID=UPI0005516D75|nr:hypothetical protein [Haloferula sp. BvORR071]
MSYRPSRGLVLCLAPLLAIGGTGAWAWSKTSQSALHEHAAGDFMALASKRREGGEERKEDSPAARKAMREGCAALKAKMLEEYPGLRIEQKPVPDEVNAFLQFYKISCMPQGSRPTMSDSLRALLDANSPWDLEKVKAALAEDPEFVALAEKIAAMHDRSSSHMPEDYVGFIAARTAKEMSDVLVLKARVAAEEGNEVEALRLVSAIRNLGADFREIEERNLLTETVAILVDLNALKSSFQHLLPSLGPDIDLAQWKEAFATTKGYTPADFADVRRGEWSTTSEFFLYPAILRQKPADGEALARFDAASYEKLVNELPGTSWAEFAKKGSLSFLGEMDGFSSKSREIAEAFATGNSEWNKGYMRAVSLMAIQQAALDLLILEQNGEALGMESASKLKPDPVSGKSYRFDPVTRTLSPPEEIAESKVESVKLPW